MVNDKQIDFIVCVNDDEMFEECTRYINDIVVPEGYTIDIISIKDAPSMATGYNAAMTASNAKYKVYLHQDVFIVNQRFIYDILDVFEDKSVGMIGVIGSSKIKKDGNYVNSWDVGRVDVYISYKTLRSDFMQNRDKTPKEVVAIDGMLMVTQYDVAWREDVFDGWDFYDISQSEEMKKAGYKIVVPYQEEVWTYHKMGINGAARYDEYRFKFLKLYSVVYEESLYTSLYNTKEDIIQQNDLMKVLIKLLEVGRYKELVEVSGQLINMPMVVAKIRDFINIMKIYTDEEINNTKHSRWYQYNSWEDTYREYRELQFVLLRSYYNKFDSRMMALKEKVKNEEVSIEAVSYISNITLPS